MQVQITETGAVVTTSNTSLNKKLVETNTQVKLERPNATQEANFVHTLKVEDSQQLKIKVKYIIILSLISFLNQVYTLHGFMLSRIVFFFFFFLRISSRNNPAGIPPGWIHQIEYFSTVLSS